MAVLDWLQQLLGGGDPEAEGAAASSQAMQPMTQPWLDKVLSGEMARGGIEDINRAFATGDTEALIGAFGPAPAAISRDIKSGLPIITRDTDRLASPNIGMGTDAPLFDLSRLTERPDVPQTPIAREPLPAKGVPDWAQSQLTDPARVEQYKQVLKLGRDIAGDQNSLGWWNTFPLRDRYIGEFGAGPGDAEWRSGMNMWSATSPRHDFPANIRQASYFGNRLAEGQGLPELVRKPQEKNPNMFNMVPTESAPKGYANFPLHIQNIENLLDPQTGLLGNAYPLSNPKPASMAQNLVGNWSVPTIDVRDLRAMGMTDKSGKPMQAVSPTGLYGHIEDTFHKPLAEELGLTPAQMQSTTWVGTPAYFGNFDRSGTSSALGTLEDSIRRTAAARGLTPEQTLIRGYLRKEFPLLGLGGGLGLNSLLSEGVNPDQRAGFQ